MTAQASISGPYASFDEWTKGRELATIGTNSGSLVLAFQGWRRFKEAFAPEIVQRAIAETSALLGRSVATCVDPFGGSGTTALACQFLGVRSTTIEVNPYLADLIEAKLCRIDVRAAARSFSNLLSETPCADAGEHFAHAPATFVEPGVAGRFLFSDGVATRLASLYAGIERIQDRDVARLLRVLLASAALEVCNATVSGKGRRYRRNWTSNVFSAIDLDRAYVRLFSSAIFDLNRYERRAELRYTLLRGDARRYIPEVEMTDVAIFSPPYPNSFDYTDVYNIELWTLRYLTSKVDNSNLRNETLRSHVQNSRDFTFENDYSPVLNEVVNALSSVSASLWNKNIPAMIGSYFADMKVVLEGLHGRLNTNGQLYMVVGDSRYAGVAVPVARILTDAALAIGYHVVSNEPFRSMRASPQQGGRQELAESLIILRR